MKLKLKDVAVLSLMGTLMCVGDFAMEWLPNIHLVGVLIVITTIVYRWYALFPIWVYILIQGFVGGFGPWWLGYTYVWPILCIIIVLIPTRLPQKIKYFLYVAVCAMHGYLFGVLYAPVQALMFGLDFHGTLAWIAAGIAFDIVHGTGNLILGTLLIYPMVKILKQTNKYTN